MQETKVIARSKTKLLLGFLGSLVFVATGLWLLGNPGVIKLVAVATIVVFGFFAVLMLKLYLDKTPGLIISTEGIVDNSSAISAGEIQWSEVTGMDEVVISGQKMLAIHVTDTEKYANTGNRMQQMAKRTNIKMVGTPINIAATGLKISHSELVALIVAYNPALSEKV